MIALRMVRLIENHSDQLSRELLHKFQTSPRCGPDLRKVPQQELTDRSYEIYHNLKDWLLNKTEGEIRRRYTELGRRRAAQGVPFSSFYWALILTRDHIWDFIQKEGVYLGPLDLQMSLELLRLLEQFFDRALYYAAIGYEEAGVSIGREVEHSRQHATV